MCTDAVSNSHTDRHPNEVFEVTFTSDNKALLESQVTHRMVTLERTIQGIPILTSQQLRFSATDPANGKIILSGSICKAVTKSLTKALATGKVIMQELDDPDTNILGNFICAKPDG